MIGLLFWATPWESFEPQPAFRRCDWCNQFYVLFVGEGKGPIWWFRWWIAPQRKVSCSLASFSSLKPPSRSFPAVWNRSRNGRRGDWVPRNSSHVCFGAVGKGKEFFWGVRSHRKRENYPGISINCWPRQADGQGCYYPTSYFSNKIISTIINPPFPSFLAFVANQCAYFALKRC